MNDFKEAMVCWQLVGENPFWDREKDISGLCGIIKLFNDKIKSQVLHMHSHIFRIQKNQEKQAHLTVKSYNLSVVINNEFITAC